MAFDEFYIHIKLRDSNMEVINKIITSNKIYNDYIN